jgi:hypothetical protein
MISRRAALGKVFYTIWCIALCLFVTSGVSGFAASKRQVSNSTVIAKSAGATALKPEGVRVPVELVPEERRKSQSLSARIAKLPAGKRFYLVFRNLQTTKQPGEIYNVYLNLEEGKTPTTTDLPVGAINFYNFEQKPRSDAFFSFDVTEVLKKLAAAKQLSEPLTVTIIPSEPPAEGAIPTVGQIELVEQ